MEKIEKNISVHVGAHGPCARIPAPKTCNKKPVRKNIRAAFDDYSNGLYFITICTHNQRHFFGKIVNGDMQFSAIGDYCQRQLDELPVHYPYAEITEYVIMPNHLHAIVWIGMSLFREKRAHEPCAPTMRSGLSVVVGGLKRAVSLFAKHNGKEFEWQRGYFDHIIRNANEYTQISAYIAHNISLWAEERPNPALD